MSRSSKGPAGSGAPLDGPPNSQPDPMIASQSARGKQSRVQDAAKAQELEQDFKTKHIGVLGVLTWILQGNGCWHEKSFDKAVVIIIDALRYDFTVPFVPKDESETVHLFHDNIPVLYETAVNNPANAFLLPFIADPPTTTLQRLKGLTTGTLPTFIDAGSNFAGTAIDEDNLVAQLHSAGKTLVQLGDDTWQSLFPGYFDDNLTHPYDSFNVWDLHTVDNGVNEHLFPLLHPQNASKWDVIFGHYLGVDHAGHRYGPNHAAMAAKLQDMDRVIRQIIAALGEDTLLVVMGDHGMDTKGDHGGESDDEVEAALWMYSKRGIFGRTSKDTLLPPKDARERFVPQIDLVPTLSLLLGMPIPFNNLGSPIEEAFAGSSGNDWANLLAVNRLSSAQINRYQHAYANAHGAGHDEQSSALWSAAEEEWKSTSKGLMSKSAAIRSSYDLYRKYQRHTLDTCRGLWANFDVPSMIEGVALLFSGIILLVLYARVLKTDRTELTAQLLSFVAVGSGIGAVGGTGLVLFGFTEMTAVESAALLAAFGSMAGGLFAMVKKPANLSLPLPSGMWGWLAIFFTVSQSVGFASNSYTIWEDEILLFFLTTFGVCAGISSMRQKSTTDRVLGVYHSILFVILGRVASFSRLCREEQMPFCRSTYYASSTSSISAPWQLGIPFLVTLLLPAVIRGFYAGSKSYEGAATLWIGFAFRLGLLITSLFWMLEGADDGEWLPMSKETLKTVRVFLAQLVLALAFGAGTGAFFYSKPCVSISVSKPPPEDPNAPPAPIIAGQQQQPRTTVTILGFGNIYGTRFFFLVVNFSLAIILMQKPMGQGAIALLICQILSLLEILDTNALTLTNSSIGPIVLGLLGSFYYFKTGHQAVLSSIQWETAFIPLSTIKYPWSPLLVILNTFGAQILAALAVPLTVLWKRPLQTHDRVSQPSPKDKFVNPATKLLSDVVQAACTHMLYLATINLATTMWAGHLRRHLMLYRIFNPRFMMGAAVLGVVDVVLMVFAVAGVRWSTLSVGEVFGW
ncbi:hypothetical protein N7462_010379 [Penicillium macrosclerotiorum]|uniref:uncharacterized protein n=1 Tax=Penicillium macrosclerotiorum TaxID=303699 RepID=UPI00254821BE|nr:uncharacterized protein N7462_010379 [Penicillium macrosclerotiorum]KAJ5669309.1 hypothetical protein N7462_010379 [Penicillium macrosclerotiorum]